MRCWLAALRNKRWLRQFWRMVRAALIGYLVVVVIAMFLEDSLIYFPSPYPEGNWNPVGLEFEDAWFQSADGTPLHGWYVPRQDARAAVLFCHGNAGNITDRVGILERLNQRAGVSVLMFDYRGYGRSKGKPNEVGILADARAARHWLAAREKIGERDVVVMGESIGGAVAVDLAARDGARALILESTFTSAPDMAASIYPWLPVRWAMHTRFDSLSKIGDYHGPLLMSHGTADTIVPIQHGRRLFAAANEPKKLIVLRGHDHNDGMPADYYDDVAKFLDEIGDR